MRYAIISDIHSNIEALNSVLRDIESEKVDDIFFLGDAVGYGPDPNLCIDEIRGGCRIIIAGNHDHGAVGLTDISTFNPYARIAVEWTAEQLTSWNKAFLLNLPLTATHKKGDIIFVHSTPKMPHEWNYIFTMWDAYDNFAYFSEKICFVGHSHRPVIIIHQENDILLREEKTSIEDNRRYIINVGSVGQPRDGNPDASYAIYDTEKSVLEIKRVPYNFAETQKKMRNAGLPAYLIER
ncbi:MAG: metallophosphoesterase family protein, partial [Nitrospirota bacterium]